MPCRCRMLSDLSCRCRPNMACRCIELPLQAKQALPLQEWPALSPSPKISIVPLQAKYGLPLQEFWNENSQPKLLKSQSNPQNSINKSQNWNHRSNIHLVRTKTPKDSDQNTQRLRNPQIKILKRNTSRTLTLIMKFRDKMLTNLRKWVATWLILILGTISTNLQLQGLQELDFPPRF